MYNSIIEVVNALKVIAPCWYEYKLTSNVDMPCITYRQSNDRVLANGDTLGYSEQSYYIKLWDKDKEDSMTKCQSIDTAMRSLGFTRIAFNELVNDEIICSIMQYRCTAKEDFITTPPTPVAEQEPEVTPAPVQTTSRRSRRNNIGE